MFECSALVSLYFILMHIVSSSESTTPVNSLSSTFPSNQDWNDDVTNTTSRSRSELSVHGISDQSQVDEIDGSVTSSEMRKFSLPEAAPSEDENVTQNGNISLNPMIKSIFFRSSDILSDSEIKLDDKENLQTNDVLPNVAKDLNLSKSLHGSVDSFTLSLNKTCTDKIAPISYGTNLTALPERVSQHIEPKSHHTTSHNELHASSENVKSGASKFSEVKPTVRSVSFTREKRNSRSKTLRHKKFGTAELDRLRRFRSATEDPPPMIRNSTSNFARLPLKITEKLDLLAQKDLTAAMLEFINVVEDENHCSAQLRHPINSILNPDVVFRTQVVKAIHASNTLTNLFGYAGTEFSNSFYTSLILGLINSDPLILGAGIIFDPERRPAGSVRYVTPFLYRDRTSGSIRQVNISKESGNRYPVDGTPGYEWYWKQRRDYSDLLWMFRDVCRLKEERSRDEGPGDLATAVVTSRQGVWGAVTFSCEAGNAWTLTYSVPFFGCISQKIIAFKGVIRLDIDIGSLDVNQCARHGPFSGTNRCKTSMQCTHIPDRGFRRGSYHCECLKGFHRVQSTTDQSPSNLSNRSVPDSLNGSWLEERHVEHLLHDSEQAPEIKNMDEEYICARCPRECPSCGGNEEEEEDCTPSERNDTLRLILLAFEILSVLIIVSFIGAVMRLRTSKTGFWCLLEVYLVGTLLLHISVSLQYIDAINVVCSIILWLREIGFAAAYGTLMLRIYRILTEAKSFQKRCRVLPVRDRDLMTILWTLLIVSVSYMMSWTTVTVDQLLPTSTLSPASRSTSGAQQGSDDGGRHVRLEENIFCNIHWCNYVIEAAELVFVGFGAYLCHCARSTISAKASANSNPPTGTSLIAAAEVTHIFIVFILEASISGMFYVVKHVLWSSLHSDQVFLMNCIRSQMTVTVGVFIILMPKFCNACKPSGRKSLIKSARPPVGAASPDGAASERKPPDATSSMVKLHAAAVGLEGAVEIDDIDLSDIRQEDIRYEFTRLYTQLEVYKTKTMRRDNPHISKRRGGRKPAHRRFSLQTFHLMKNKHPVTATASGTLLPTQAAVAYRSGGGGGSGAGSIRTFVTARQSESIPRSSLANTDDTSRSLTPDESSNSNECSSSAAAASAVAAAGKVAKESSSSASHSGPTATAAAALTKSAPRSSTVQQQQQLQSSVRTSVHVPQTASKTTRPAQTGQEMSSVGDISSDGVSLQDLDEQALLGSCASELQALSSSSAVKTEREVSETSISPDQISCVQAAGKANNVIADNVRRQSADAVNAESIRDGDDSNHKEPYVQAEPFRDMYDADVMTASHPHSSGVSFAPLSCGNISSEHSTESRRDSSTIRSVGVRIESSASSSSSSSDDISDAVTIKDANASAESKPVDTEVAFPSETGLPEQDASCAVIDETSVSAGNSPVVTSPVVTSPVVTSPVVTSPVVTSPVVTSPVVTSPVVTSPVVTSPVVTSPDALLSGSDLMTSPNLSVSQSSVDPQIISHISNSSDDCSNVSSAAIVHETLASVIVSSLTAYSPTNSISSDSESPPPVLTSASRASGLPQTFDASCSVVDAQRTVDDCHEVTGSAPSEHISPAPIDAPSTSSAAGAAPGAGGASVLCTDEESLSSFRISADTVSADNSLPDDNDQN